MFWTAVQTKRHAEDEALINVVVQGFTAYLPKADLGRPGHPSIRPMFARFLFVLMDHIFDNHRASLRSTRGCVGLLSFGGEPGIIRSHEIERMQGFEVKGVVPLPFAFTQGQVLRVNRRDHLLHDQLVIFQGMSSKARALVLWHLFGTQSKTTVPLSCLEAA